MDLISRVHFICYRVRYFLHLNTLFINRHHVYYNCKSIDISLVLNLPGATKHASKTKSDFFCVINNIHKNKTTESTFTPITSGTAM